MSKSVSIGTGLAGLVLGIGLTLFFGFRDATIEGISVGSIFNPQSGATRAVNAVTGILKNLGANNAADSLNSITSAAAASARNANMPGLIIGIAIAIVGAVLLFVGIKIKKKPNS